MQCDMRTCSRIDYQTEINMNSKLFIVLFAAIFTAVSAMTCKCARGPTVLTRKVCQELSFKVGTDSKHTDFGRTTCYNMTKDNTTKYFIPQCKKDGGDRWVCY
ncbi:hypothetical protein CU097_015826 [Rhizopus azygosporus]|uniref:Uncharacterized protein n=1 Tax=Rhizopus azygosporus TaxID=86630 RepID=A0A367KGA8_RHIAZ|nr:hypothetical protein CU097_015826 [Rhizopus azygosporus]